VLIELGTRLQLPAFVTASGARRYRDYPDFIVHYETSPGSGIGFLSGWRGQGGEKFLKGEPNPRQWEMYAQHHCVYHHELPKSYQYMRNWNKGYLHWARAHGLIRYADPIGLNLYSEVLQRFRLAAQGQGSGRQPPARLAARVATYCDPLPFYYEPLEAGLVDTQRYPLNALTQRPMAMYHSWDSQNAWLRQIHGHNVLFVNPQVGIAHGFGDGDWIWVESPQGAVRCQCRFSEAVEPGTVWTWNAIGKAAGAWGLAPDAEESRRGFLLNHLISEELPATSAGDHLSNADPVTGQAAWFDVRVRVRKAEPGEPATTLPQFAPQRRVPGQGRSPGRWLAYVAGRLGRR
jgi:anaerobic selenocysteine-containing dehydrogenase